MIQPNEETQQIRSVQFITIGDQGYIPAPLIRITTCGLLTIEVVDEVISADPPQARYALLTPEQLRGRGTGPALMLLKLLLNRPERFASRAWLIEQFCRDGELFSTVRIDNIVSQLRGLLCPPASQVLRKQLVVHVRNSGSDGYQLAASPLIWCDQDALAWNVEQATRMERFHDNALPFWERAYELARRGPYLPGDVYNDWATFRREEVAGMLRQSVQALARIYQAQHGAAGEEEALRLLRSYWLEHPHEEDTLRPLMELLGRRECTHEALKYYERLCEVLKEDEREPDALTQDVVAYLKAKQIQRLPQPRSLSEFDSEFERPAPYGVYEYFLPLTTSLQDAQENPQPYTPEVLSEQHVFNPFMGEVPARTGRLFQQIISALHSSASLDKTLLELLDQQTRMLWQHREALSMPLELFYRQVLDHLSQLQAFLESSLLPGERMKLCDLSSLTLLLAGVVLYDMGNYPSARQVMHIAAQASLEADNSFLHGLIYTWMSFTWTYAGSFSLALPCVLKAQSLIEQGSDNNAKAWVAAVHAEIRANLHQKDDCLQALHQAERLLPPLSDDTSYLFGFNEVLLDGYKGVCLQQFYQRQRPETHAYLVEAKEALERALHSETPRRRKRYYLGDLSKVEARRGEIEAACLYAEQSLMIPSAIESKSMWQRIVDVRSLLQPYRAEAPVKALETHIQTQFMNHQI